MIMILTPRRQWLVINAPGGNISKGKEISGYTQAAPDIDTGTVDHVSCSGHRPGMDTYIRITTFRCPPICVRIDGSEGSVRH